MTRNRTLVGLATLIFLLGAGLIVIWPSSAERSSATVLPPPTELARSSGAEVAAGAEFEPFWVATHRSTELWAGPGPGAASYGPVEPGAPLRVLAPQDAPWLYVFNPVTEGVAWVAAAAVGPSTEPTAAEITELRNPTPAPFQPYWAVTHRPAVAWSSPEPDAQAFNRVPQWRYLQVVAPVEGSRVYIFDPRAEGYAYVDHDALGPTDPPSDDYFALSPLQAGETLALPARIVGSAAGRYHNQPVVVREAVDRGAAGRGFIIDESVYVAASNVRAPQLPQRTFPGRWIDANLSEPVLVTAYEGEHPVYAAMAVKGVASFPTPTGVFRILRRVANETMDSATLGIPRNSPGGYYLRNVLFTQYFTGDGAAIHYNYWRSTWGYAGSHGCLGMNYADSEFFWNFAQVGTPISIHF